MFDRISHLGSLLRVRYLSPLHVFEKALGSSSAHTQRRKVLAEMAGQKGYATVQRGREDRNR
ncbi:MAG: hypothetical protein ABSD29_14105 [Verrucomicrobiota bacterium]